METLTDRNGKTEAEFLREYDVTKYFRPSVTVDAAVYRRVGAARAEKIELLLIKRGGHPFIGMYALPGGFVEQNESCEQAVLRELKEETAAERIDFKQLVTVSTPGRDPRWRCISVVYGGEIKSDIPTAAGDDAAAAEWFTVTRTPDGLHFRSDSAEFDVKLKIVRDAFGAVDINNTEIIERGKTAFDHAKVIYYIMDGLNKEAEHGA